MFFHNVFILVLPKGFEPTLNGLEPPVLTITPKEKVVTSIGLEPILKVPKTFVLTTTL